MTQGAPDLNLPYKDLPSVPEVFVDGMHLMIWNGQFAHLTLTVNRMDEPKGQKKPSGTRATAARLVLSPNAVIEIHNKLSQLIAMLEQSGVVKREAPVSVGSGSVQ